jgi:hypothetical protein
MMSFDWQGFVAAEGCSDQIVVGDERIFFFSPDRGRISAVAELAEKYSLAVLFDRCV